MSEEMRQETVNEVTDTPAEEVASPITNSVQKLREVSMVVTKLGQDLNQLVTVLEELTTMMKLFSGFGKKDQGQSGSAMPLALLTTLLSKSGANSPTGSPDLAQLLFALLGQQSGQNK